MSEGFRLPSTASRGRPYIRPKPGDPRDVTAEMAILAGRSPNGSGAANLRATREDPRTFAQGQPPHDGMRASPVELLRSGRLADALKAQQADEQRRIDEQDARAKAEYAEFLAWREQQGLPPVDDEVPVEIDDQSGVHEIEPERYQRADDAEIQIDWPTTAHDNPPLPVSGRGRFEMPVQTRQPSPPPPPARPAPRREPPREPEPEPEATPLTCRPITNDDFDRMWDWVRQDPEGAKQFVGRTLANSRALGDFLDALVKGEESGLSFVRAVDVDGVNVGFVSLMPVNYESNTAMMHLFVGPSWRGKFVDLFPLLLAAARSLIPPTMHLAIYSTVSTKVLERFLPQFHFWSYTVWVQNGAAPAGPPQRQRK